MWLESIITWYHYGLYIILSFCFTRLAANDHITTSLLPYHFMFNCSCIVSSMDEHESVILVSVPQLVQGWWWWWGWMVCSLSKLSSVKEKLNKLHKTCKKKFMYYCYVIHTEFDVQFINKP